MCVNNKQIFIPLIGYHGVVQEDTAVRRPITVLAVADILQIPVLSELLATFAGYIPALIAGLVILVVGVLVAEYAGEIAAESTPSNVSAVASGAVRLFVYYITITLALGAIGIETAILMNFFTVFVAALFGALALALAIGIGVSVGLGSKDYVAENIDEWADQAQDAVTDSESNERLE